jgi:TRAP-type mannitol/chloroaromatic compound transport system permease small subunit
LVYGIVSERARLWIDVIGVLLFLMPICLILIALTWPWFVASWAINETSSNAGGLYLWPVKLLLPVGFGLMVLQGISELIKRVAALVHVADVEFKYERPLQ